MIRKFFFLSAALICLWFAGCAGRYEAAYSLAETLKECVVPSTDLLLKKEGFTIGYSEKYRQALWVEYLLSGESLAGEQVIRDDIFRADPAVKKFPVTPGEYFRSGYDRGHLAPAADMSYSYGSMRDSFLMSNITPQKPGCNRGIWLKAEKQVRQWAKQEGLLMVITGPIFGRDGKRMGKYGLPVPEAFYKVILDLTPPEKMIAFIVPNEGSNKDLTAFVCTVDEVEKRSKLDFFSRMDDSKESELEAAADFGMWKSKRDD